MKRLCRVIKRTLTALERCCTGWPKNGTIGQWRRRLECVVQQEGGHIEHLMQKLQDVTVTLDNN